MEKYEKPGERLVSKVPNKEYKDNYDSIFGKKESWLDRRERENKKTCLARPEGGCMCTGICKEAKDD